MRRIVALALFVSGCAHAAIRKPSDCGQLEVEQRLECGVCVLQNEAGGLLGTFEYRPDAKPGSRCVTVK